MTNEIMEINKEKNVQKIFLFFNSIRYFHILLKYLCNNIVIDVDITKYERKLCPLYT